MEKKAVSGIMLTLLLIGMLTLAFNIQPVKAALDFSKHVIDGNFDGANDVYAVDIDGDGDIDVLGGAYLENIAWYENDGSESFTKYTIGSMGASSVHAADIDGDGDIDVVGINDDFPDNGEIYWWENVNGDGSSWATHVIIANTINRGRSVYAIDLDTDGDIDVLHGAYSPKELEWWENVNGDGSSWARHLISQTTLSLNSIFPIDLDGDGDIDVLGADVNFGASDIYWWENNGLESFTIHSIDLSFNYAFDVYATDVDADGDIDVLGAARDADDIAWYENDGSESFTKYIIDGSFDGASSVYATDVDADGDIDVLGAARDADDIAWYENDGSESFTKYIIDGSFDGASSVYATDVDADGDIDVLGAAFYADDIAWWKNNQSNVWPMIGYNPASTSFSPSTAPNTNATAWVSDMPGGSGWSSPVVAEGKVFIGIGWTPNFTAWDEETGDFLWSFEAAADIDIRVSAAVAYGMVFFGAGPPSVPEGWIYALNATTGEQIWNFTTEGDVRASPVVTEGRLYIGGDLDSTGKVYCINATTGESIWNYTTQDRMESVAVAYGKVYASSGHWETSTKAAIYALDMYDGSLVWSFGTDRTLAGTLSVANGNVYFAVSNIGSNFIFYALNATNGNEIWNTTRYSNGEGGRTAVAYGKVFFVTGRGARGVYALNETNGDEIWAFPIIPEEPVPGHYNNPRGGPVVADSKVFFAVAYPSHMFYAVNETTGAVVWSYKLGGSVHSSSSAIANGRVFVADHYDKKLYAFGGPPYVARIKAYCYTEGSDISVGITMDGSPTGYNTPHTFTGLTGAHNFTVPDTDSNGDPFVQWNTGETSTTITVTTGGTYTAYYRTRYNLTITTTTGGTTDPSPGTYTYWEGTIVSVTAIPSLGYLLDHWELDEANVGSQDPIIVTMDSNHTLHAVFKPAYTLTITTTTGGTTNPSSGTYTYTEGTIVTVTAIPDLAYNFDYWKIDNKGRKYTDNPISVTMDKDHTLHAVFEYSPPPVGVGGIISSIDKLGLLAPYIGLAIAVVVATIGAVYARKRWLRKAVVHKS